MPSFSIKSSSGTGELEFFGRDPLDTELPLESFWVRLTDLNLSAANKVYGGYASDHPARLFVEMAALWRGWPDQLTWESLEGELKLSSTQDGTGHVSIRSELRSGPMEQDWDAATTVMVDAGQLDRLARHARSFFGKEGSYREE